MFAVVSSGGKQYRVEPGGTVLVDRMTSAPGSSITFDRVLLIGEGDETTVGSPLVSGASVSGTVLGEELGPKLVIFKFKQKVKYRRRTGHRQHLTLVRIDEINAQGGSSKAKAAAKAEPEANAGTSPAADASAPDAKPKPRASRARTAKPKAAEADASASSEEATEKPKRRAPARAKKADQADTAEE
jgi:large subunit ribosomal protein L21